MEISVKNLYFAGIQKELLVLCKVIRTPESCKFLLVECEIQPKESGIPLTIEIRKHKINRTQNTAGL